MNDKVHPSIDEVEKFYKTPPIQLNDGTFGCPMPSCDHVAPTPNAIGPHKASHARFHGLIKPTGVKKGTKRNYAVSSSSSRTKKRIECPLCGIMIGRGHLKQHIEGKHRKSRAEAAELTNPVLAATRANPNHGNQHSSELDLIAGDREAAQVVANAIMPVRVEQAKAAEMSASDMALAVIMSQVNGSIPSTALPLVVEYVEQTKAVIAAVRGEVVE